MDHDGIQIVGNGSRSVREKEKRPTESNEGND